MSSKPSFGSVIIADTIMTRAKRIATVLSKKFGLTSTHVSSWEELQTHAVKSPGNILLLVAFDFPFDTPESTVASVDSKWALIALHVGDLIKSLLNTQRNVGAILYGPQPPAQVPQQMVVTEVESVFSQEGLGRSMDILAGNIKRKFWIEIAVNPPDPENVMAKPSTKLELHFSLRGSDCAASSLPHESITEIESQSLASEFRSWAKESHKKEAPGRLRNLAIRVNKLVYQGGLKHLLNIAGQDADIGICFSGRAEALAYPLDLVLLDAGTSKYLHKEYPVCWSVPRRDVCIEVGYPVKRPEEIRQIDGRMEIFAANAGGWASLANGDLEFDNLSNPIIEVSEICEVIRERTRVYVPTKAKKRKATFAAVQQSLPDTDGDQIVFLHYCGHGVTTDEAGEIIEWGGLALPDGPGKIEIVRVKDIHERLLKRRKVGKPVHFGFFNCCDLGAFGRQKSRIRSMYNSILHGLLPIDVLICQRWEVNDCLARHFAVAFYKEFFGTPSRTIHEALWEARKRIEEFTTRRDLHVACRNTKCGHHRKKGEIAGGDDNFTWLSPVLVLGTTPF
jgi:hypothetical protein